MNLGGSTLRDFLKKLGWFFCLIIYILDNSDKNY